MAKNIVKEMLENMGKGKKEFSFTATGNGYILVVADNGVNIKNFIKSVREFRGVDIWWSDLQQLIKDIYDNKMQNAVEMEVCDHNTNKDTYNILIITPTEQDLQTEFKGILSSKSLAKFGELKVLTVCRDGKKTFCRPDSETERE